MRHAEAVPCPKDIEERVSQMESLSVDWPDSDELDQSYYESGENIDDLLIAYIKKNTEQGAAPN